MKMIKKVLAAVLAMAMVIGMMAMSTFAADREVTVTVKWDAAKDEETMNCWCWGSIENYTGGTWPGTEMTKNADGTWTAKITVTDDEDTELGFIPSCSLGQTVDVKFPIADSVTIVVSDKKEVQEDGTEGKNYIASVEGDVAGGDSSVMVYVVAAVVAVAAAVTVVCKRRSVEA